MFSNLNVNNIGDHSLPFHGGDAVELGFEGAQRLEREAVGILVRLCGGNPASVAGYICEGGTIGNIAGMWMGRNSLTSQSDDNERVAVLTTSLAHYSVVKASDVIGTGKVKYVGCNASGEISIELLEMNIRELHDQGSCNLFIIVLSAGSTMIGSVDDVGSVHSLRLRLEAELGIKTYLHVDAAFGGFVLPFLSNPIAFGFDSGADSVVVDPHKMGGVPFGCGVVMYRSAIADTVTRPANYLNSESDHCFNGSRSGAMAAALWSSLHHYGYDSLCSRVQDCIRLRDHAVAKLSEIKYLKTIVGKTNQVCLLPINNPGIVNAMTRIIQGDPYFMHMATLPGDLADPQSDPVPATKMILMPHHEEWQVDQFVSDINLP